MTKKLILWLPMIVSLICHYGFSEARAVEVIKIGTLAPANSPWGQTLKSWADAVSARTNGAVVIQPFYGGTQGDEAQIIAKIKTGQLDGAMVTAVGLGAIYKPIIALELPGLFTTWNKLTSARDVLSAEFENGMATAGFSLIGWGDVGASHLMSKGFAIRTPSDLKGKKPLLWRDDFTAPIFYQVIGGITPVPLNIPEVLPQLNVGNINVLKAPSLVAEQFQWSSKLDTIQDNVMNMEIGALVLSSKRLQNLPADQQQIIKDLGKTATDSLNRNIRTAEDASFARLKTKMKVITLTPDELAQWRDIWSQMRLRLSQGVFSTIFISRLEILAQ
jgi:TRAP-type C4-dicarboxylate transport system substrate-binding protein